MKTPHILIPGMLALAAALLAGCSGNSTHEFQGYIEGEYVYVASPLGGALTNLAVARGDEVKSGQLLFALERESEASAVRQAEKNLAQSQSQLEDLMKGMRPSEIASLEAQLQQAQANLQMAGDDLVRREQLGGAQVVSKEELDQARAQRDADQAQVDQLASDLETAKLGGREDAIHAAQAAVESQKPRWTRPNGRLIKSSSSRQRMRLCRTHCIVRANGLRPGNPVVVLLPPENLKVRFFVPQEILPEIKTGETVNVSFDGAAHLYSATISYISTQVEFTPPVIYNRANRAKLVFMIEAKFSPADAPELRPGQPVDVKLK